ncbi:MAG: glycosyltransferase family 39 protein [Elusimicrobia bacterium]|nr:glycosyltransferase family 39 protein [Elusimicrobiota bacterium]
MTRHQAYRTLCHTGLAALWVFHGVLNWIWLTQDTLPPRWDESVHLQTAWDYQQYLRQGKWSRLWTTPLKPGHPPYPPLYHWTAATILGSSKTAEDRAAWINWLYLVLLCFSLYWIGFTLKDHGTGLFAALLVSCLPLNLDLFRKHLTDPALIALVAFAYACLIRSLHFQFIGWSLAFGAACGLGMLSKWTFGTYLLPAVWIWLSALLHKKTRLHALSAAALAAIVFLPWLWNNLGPLLIRLPQAAADVQPGVASGIQEWGNWSWYFWTILRDTYPPFFFLFLASLLFYPYLRMPSKKLLLFWILASYLFWSAVPNKNPRYIFPAVSALCIITAVGLPAKVRRILTLPILLFAVYFSFSNRPAKNFTWLGRSLPYLFSEPPRQQDWRHPEILGAIAQRRDLSRPFSNVTLVSNHPYLNGPTLTWAALQAGVSGSIVVRGTRKRLGEMSEFVLYKSGDKGPGQERTTLANAAQKIEDRKSWFYRAFEPAQGWRMPDGSLVTLFRQKRLKHPPLFKTLYKTAGFETGHVRVKNLTVWLGPWRWREGVYETADVAAQEISLRGLTLRDPKFRMKKVAFVPAEPGNWTDLRFLKMDSVQILSGTLSKKTLEQFLEARVKGLSNAQIALGNPLHIQADFKGKTAHLILWLNYDKKKKLLQLRLGQTRWGPYRIPGKWLASLAHKDLSLRPNPETPFEIQLEQIRIAQDTIELQ